MIYYTSIEQSEKLLELGLSLKSADMFYNEEPDEIYPKDIVDTKCPSVIREEHKHYLEEYGIPCWSLGALSNVIYKFVIHEYGLKGWVGMYVCSISEFTTYYANDADVVHEEKGKTLLEAVYNMVCYLLENGLIKNCKS